MEYRRKEPGEHSPHQHHIMEPNFPVTISCDYDQRPYFYTHTCPSNVFLLHPSSFPSYGQSPSNPQLPAYFASFDVPYEDILKLPTGYTGYAPPGYVPPYSKVGEEEGWYDRTPREEYYAERRKQLLHILDPNPNKKPLYKFIVAGPEAYPSLRRAQAEEGYPCTRRADACTSS